MRTALFFIICFCFNYSCFSQDFITKRSGDEIKAKILEVTSTEVKYKKFDYESGPTFSISKSEIMVIRYQNGNTEYVNGNSSQIVAVEAESDMASKGKKDASLNYKGQNGGAGWVAATTIALSPLFGLVPAFVCADQEPALENMKYPNEKLMNNEQYQMAYTEQAHKIKKKKIWKTYAIASGVWLVLISLISG